MADSEPLAEDRRSCEPPKTLSRERRSFARLDPEGSGRATAGENREATVGEVDRDIVKARGAE